MTPVTITQLRSSAAVDLMTAARAPGPGPDQGLRAGPPPGVPCRVIRIGEIYRIPTPGLLELLGVTAEEPRSPAATRPA